MGRRTAHSQAQEHARVENLVDFQKTEGDVGNVVEDIQCTSVNLGASELCHPKN